MDGKTVKLVYDAFKAPIKLVFLTLITRTMYPHETLKKW